MKLVEAFCVGDLPRKLNDLVCGKMHSTPLDVETALCVLKALNAFLFYGSRRLSSRQNTMHRVLDNSTLRKHREWLQDWSKLSLVPVESPWLRPSGRMIRTRRSEGVFIVACSILTVSVAVVVKIIGRRHPIHKPRIQISLCQSVLPWLQLYTLSLRALHYAGYRSSCGQWHVVQNLNLMLNYTS